MKARLALWVCAGLVAVAAVLSAQSNVLLDTQFEAKLKALKADDAEGHFKLALEAFAEGLYEETKVAADRMLAVDKEDTRGKYLKAAAAHYQMAPQGGGLPPVVRPGQPDIPRPPVEPVVGPMAGMELTDEQVDEIWTKHGAKFLAIQNSILLRRCASDQCHGGERASGGFSLKRPRNAADRRTVVENFRMVEGLVNKTDLANSRILTVTLAGKEEHPGGPIFANDRNSQYQQLKRWAESLPGLFGE